MSHAAKHVVSVSLGSSARDVDVTVELLGEMVRIQRRGTDGSVAGARDLVAELDGQVDAIGLGGLDLFLQWMGRRYYFREARVIAAAAKRTPVVCGAGLKDTLERRAVALLDDSVGWHGRRVLLTVAVDRFGMAEALALHGADTRFGDLMFALGLPWPIHSMRTLDRVARTLAPPLTKLPVSWLYPTGSKQNEPATSQRFARHYAWAEVVAGDWHTIRRYAPERLDGLTRAQVQAFPENILWDMDLLVGAAGRSALEADDPRGAIDELFDELVELHHLFGGKGPIRFRYIHDFQYGFDWAKWVAKAPVERREYGPFSLPFLRALRERGHELVRLIGMNDRTYPPLGEGQTRNPFAFSREPDAELRLYRDLASRGWIPVETWSVHGRVRWDLPFQDLRAARAAELGLAGPPA